MAFFLLFWKNKCISKKWQKKSSNKTIPVQFYKIVFTLVTKTNTSFSIPSYSWKKKKNWTLHVLPLKHSDPLLVHNNITALNNTIWFRIKCEWRKGREGCTEKTWNRHVMVLPVANRLQSTTEVILTDFILNRRVEAVLAWHTGPKLHTGLLFITVSFKTCDRFRDSVASRLRSLDSFLHHMVFNILFNVHCKLLVARINPKTIVLKINILSHADSGCQTSKKKKKRQLQLILHVWTFPSM